MYLKRIRNKEKKIMITVEEKEDLPIFLHCTGGLESVTTRHFNKSVKPVLHLHNHSWRLKDET